ncbi:MAG: 2Fe-2S iron-sulfur cluster-binding protein [Bdellovibrionota bacterium]
MKVIFRFVDGDVEVDAYKELNLLAHAQLIERSLQSRCGGQCECSTCRVRLISGRLSPMQTDEMNLLKKARALDGESVRLACQAFPDSELVVIEVPQGKFSDARFNVVNQK